MTRVKLCGLMSRDDMGIAVKAGADSLGFVTEYPVAVPWNLKREESARLAAQAPPFVTTTAVVGGSVRDMVDIALTVHPHFLQLHGDETPEMIRDVCRALEKTGIRVLKAMRIDVDTGEARFQDTDPVRAAKKISGLGVAGLVVDSKTSSRPAGTGVALDWSLARQIADSIDVPLILAGGLTALNVTEAIEKVRPYGVDVISGVESAPGVKDEKLMAAFVTAAKGQKL